MTLHRELLIGGKDVPAASGRTARDVNPYTGEVYATVAAAGAGDVTRAVDAADAAFEEWAAVSPFARRKILLDAADLLESRSEQAAAHMAGEAGGTRPWAASTWRWPPRCSARPPRPSRLRAVRC